MKKRSRIRTENKMENKNESMNLFVRNVLTLLKWILFAVVTGVVLGVVGAYFAQSISFVTELRNTHPWILYLLPFMGLLIVFIYQFEKQGGGTNLILDAAREGNDIPLRMAPMIFSATVLTHFGGGSAGREGAALQLGGSIAQNIGKIFRLDKKDSKIMIRCGMAAGFSALFGTPLAATVFAVEVITVGAMQYSALFPCSVAALTAFETAKLCGGHAEAFPLHQIPEFALEGAMKIALLALLCAGLSVIFCKTLHGAEHLYQKFIKNPYVRIFVGGILVILLAKLLGTTDYLGGGMNIVEKAVEGEVFWAAFLLKLLFTAVSLGAGYKGGEIVPTLFVGGTFGCLLGQILGFSPSLCAACGMIALFSAVTNSPLASLVLGFELFGFEGMPYYLIAVAIGYAASGYFGLYHSQIVKYAKLEPEQIDQKVRE